MRPGNRRPLRQAQRGAAAIFAAVSLVTLFSAVALAIDIGRLYYANRDLQRLADLAAIDGARVRSQCLGSAGLEGVSAEVEASLKRNRRPEGATVITRLGLRRVNAQGLQVFQPVAAGAAADSVQVALSAPSPARILPLFTGEASRTLTTRAAAQGEWVASASIGPPREASANGNYRPLLLGSGGSGGSPGLGGGLGGGSDGASASLSISDVLNANGEVQTDLPDMQTPTPVLGLLSQIAALLDQTGDGAAAAAVNNYASTVAAGATVVPAEVFGLPAEGSFEGATTTVGDALNAIAGAVSNGEPLPLGGLCDLVALDDLPTAQILPAFCDTTVTVRVRQPSNTGVFNSSAQTGSTSTTSSSGSAANSGGGLAEVQVGFINPVDGQPLTLPLLALAEPARARVTALSCARLGQAFNQAEITANGPRFTFAVGSSIRFDQAAANPGSDAAGALDDIAPTPLIRTSVQQLLTGAGLGGVLLGNPLNQPFLSQPVTISVRAGPVRVGSGRDESLCLQGPPFGVAEQCNGAPATVGGVSSQVAADQLASGLRDLEIMVDAPQGLPPALDTAVDAATRTLTDTLAQRLDPAVREAAKLLVPVLQSVNLVVGESSVYLDSASAMQPRIYAQ